MEQKSTGGAIDILYPKNLHWNNINVAFILSFVTPIDSSPKEKKEKKETVNKKRKIVTNLIYDP